MNYKSFLTAGAILCVTTLNAQTFTEWDNVDVWDVNRQRAHTLELPMSENMTHTANGLYAFDQSVLPESSPWYLSLNGTWKFKWVGTPTSASSTFMQDNFNASAWDDIEVPCAWQVYGLRKGKAWDKPLYVNTRYPFTYTADYSVMGDRSTDNYTYAGTMKNPVGSYRRDFELPAQWEGRDVYVRFNGAGHGIYVWVNGQYVGYSEDSYLPAEFKITDFVRTGTNNISVRCYRFTSGSFLECQDYWRLTGLTRDVFLWSAPKNQIRDFFFRTKTLSSDGTSATAQLDVTTSGSDEQGMRIVAILTDGTERARVEKTLTKAGTVTLSMNDLSGIKPWSAEEPNLYGLYIQLFKGEELVDQRYCRVGLRTISVRKDGALLINGRRVVFHGVNRHSFSAEGGRTVSREEIEADIKQMKRLNINAIRTSHYPNNPYFYDLCDTYGMYVLAEADVECHGNTGLSSVERFRMPMVVRNVRHVLSLRNHTSICLWSYGNESGGGNNFQTVEDSIKRHDTTRLTHYEGNSTWAGVTSTMYASVRDIENRLKNNLNDYKAGKSVRPHIQCENTHAMGNSMGNQREYFNLYENYPSSAGEFIWDWKDQGLRTKNSAGKNYFAYGGDFGDKPNDQDFCCNGVVLADGTLTSKSYNVKKIYQPVDFYRNVKGEFIAKSKLSQRTTEGYSFSYQLLEDGIPVLTKSLGVLNIPAADSIVLDVDYTYERKAERDYAIQFSVKQNEATWWAEADYEVASEQIELQKGTRPTYVNTSEATLSTTVSGSSATITGKDFIITFSKGQLATYKLNGESLISKPIQLCAFRSPTSNDKEIHEQWDNYGLRALTLSYGKLNVEEAADQRSVTVDVTNTYKGQNGASFSVKTTYHIFSDGTVCASHVIDPEIKGIQLPRLGVRLEMPKGMEQYAWCGRGPWDSYRDRKESALPAVHESTVADQWANYVLPQETGNKEDVRWFTLRDDAGKGLLFVAPDKKICVSATHWRPEENYTDRGNRARHPYEVKTTTTTVVNIDAYQRALGNASCGSGVLTEYQIASGRTYLSYLFKPLSQPMNMKDLSEEANMSSPIAPFVEIKRNDKGYAVLSTSATATILYKINGGETKTYTEPVDMQDGGIIEAWSTGEGLLEGPHNTTTFPLYMDKTTWTIVSYDSEQGGNEAVKNCIDGNPSTIWHTSYGSNKTDCPHEVIIDLKENYELQALTYRGREDGGNGRVADYSIYVSTTPKVWGEPVATGTFANNSTEQKTLFNQQAIGRYVRFVIRSTHDNNMYASVAELDVEASRRVQDVEQPKSVLASTTPYYYIQHIASGLFLHYSSNPNEGDYCLGEVNENNLTDYTYQFKFTAVKGFGAMYTVKGRNPAKFWSMRSNKWALEAQTSASGAAGWFEVEQIDETNVKLRCSGRYTKQLNFDQTIVGGYVYVDKSSGALFRLIKQSDISNVVAIDKVEQTSAPATFYTLDGVKHTKPQKGVNITDGQLQIHVNK